MARQIQVRKRARAAGCPEGALAIYSGIGHPILSRWISGKIKFDHSRRQRIELVLRSIEALVASSRVPIDFRDTKRVAPLLRAFQETANSGRQKPAAASDAVQSAAAS